MNQLKIDTLLKYTSLSNINTSPNGGHLALVSAQLRHDKNDYMHRFHTYDGLKINNHFNLKNSGKYFWETEHSILYFDEKTKEDKQAKKHRHTVIYRYDINAKTHELAYTVPFPLSSLEVLDNALLLHASLTVEEHVYFDTVEKRDAFIKHELENTDFETITSVPFYADGGTFTRNRASQVFLYQDGHYTPLGAKDENIANITIHDHKIYYTYAKNDGKPSYYADLRSFDINTKTQSDLTTDSKMSFSKLFVLKNELYALASDKKEYGLNQNGDFYKLTENGLIKVLDFGYSANNTVGSDVRYGASKTQRTFNEKFYFIGTYHHHTVLYTFDGTTLEKTDVQENAMDGFDFYNDQLMTIEIHSDHPQELYENHKRVSKFNTKIMKDMQISTPIHHPFVNDGVNLDGWVLLPQDYDENQTYPSILNIHGGPKTIYSSIFYNEMQVWAAQGYIVYFMNPRGSDCFDNDFADIRGKYGSIDYDDLMRFTDLISTHYSLDLDRMGVTGGSYGGFMTNWIVSHTNRFKAAATQRSISNWTSFAGTSDIGSYFAQDQTSFDPISEIEGAWNLSPLKYADNISTPLLFIHSDEDYRCPIEQAMQLYTRIRMNDVDTKFIWFKRENHDLSRSGRPQSRIKRLTEITHWMNDHLK